MGRARVLLRGGGVLIAGQAVGQVVSLARNLIVARMLGPENFGVAATLAIAVGLFEMISDLSVDRLLVQAKDGDDAHFQATAQSLQIIRGLSLSILLYLAARPITTLFSVPDALLDFKFIALLPLIRGFYHMDVKRMHRRYRFTADVATELIPQILLLMCAWPLVRIFQDYTAMVWLTILQVASATALTHVFRERPYRLAWRKDYFWRISVFGWPLMLNGALMFVVFQGDRLVVAGLYSMGELGVYSVATMLVTSVTFAFAKLGGKLFLPFLSEAGDGKVSFEEKCQLVMSAYCLICVLVSVGFVFLGRQLVDLLYGIQYVEAGTVIGWVVLAQSLNLVKAMVILAAFSKADTKLALFSNIAGSLGTLFAVIVGIYGLDIVYVPICMICGNTFAIAVAMARFRLVHRMRIGILLVPISVLAGAMLMAIVVRKVLPDVPYINIPTATILASVIIPAFFVLEPVRQVAARWTIQMLPNG